MDRIKLRQRLMKHIGTSLEEEVLSVGGLDTSFLTAGAGPPLVLLHGASAAGALGWYPIIGALAKRFYVIAPDCPGYGESAKPAAPYDTPFFLEWLDGFLDALDVGAVMLAGLSQGGAISLKFALRRPERVERLVLVDAAGLTNRLPLGFVLGIVWAALLPSERAARWVMRYVVSDPEQIDESVVDLLTYGGLVAQAPGGRRVLWRGRGRVTRKVPASQLRRIRQPTLLLWGEDDRIFPVSIAQSAAKTIPDASLYVVPKAGHAPMFEQPQALLAGLLSFLAKTADVTSGPPDSTTAAPVVSFSR